MLRTARIARPSRARPRLLRAVAASTLVLTAAGCGGDGDERAEDPGEQKMSTSMSDNYDIELLHATGGGGTVSDLMTPLETSADIRRFGGTLANRGLRKQVTDALHALQRDDRSAYAAVVTVGCDVPPGVEVAPGVGGLRISAKEIADPTPECYAPVTTVAVVSPK